MNYQDFCKEIRNEVKASLGDGYKVKLEQVQKNNGLILISLIILKDGETVTPNIYLEPYYSKYQISRQLSKIVEDIISQYNIAEKDFVVPACLSSDFISIKDKLFCKLINYERNKDFLNNVPHVKWLDLAIIFCLLVKKDPEGIGSITIKNDLMERWGITLDILHTVALDNTPLLFESTVRPMNDVIRGLVLDQLPTSDTIDDFDDILSEILEQNNTNNSKHPMFVASNKAGLNGASWLLQRNEIKQLSKSLHTNLYILPSSVHEVIIVPSNEVGISENDLYQMVCDVNATQVAPNEFLSDNVYLYTREDDSLIPLY